MERTILTGIIAVLVAGCAFSGVAPDGRRNYWMLNQSQMLEFKPGVTTKADVETALGKPHSLVVFRNLSEEAWDYGYLNGNIRMLAQFHFDMRGVYKYHAERYIGRSNRPFD